MPHLRTILNRRAPILLGAGAALALAGCSPSVADGEDLAVMTAFYPLEYVAQEVAGDKATVEPLAPAADAHNVELSPNVVARMSGADLVVYLSGFQNAVDEAVQQASPRRVLDVADAANLIVNNEQGHGHGHAGHDHARGDHAHDDHAHDDDHASDHDDHAHEDDHAPAPTGLSGHLGHDHGPIDPHFWLDPLRLADVTGAVADALASADETNAETYRANADRLAGELRALDEEFHDGLARCEGDTIVVTHDAYGYLADAYGLEIVSIAGLDPESEPSPARMVEVAEVARATGVSTVFLGSPEDQVARALAADLGLATAILDPLETQQEPHADYPAVMRANLAALQEALQCR